MPPGLPNGLAASWMLPVLGSPVFRHWFTPDCHGAAVGLSPSLTVHFLVLERGAFLCGPSPPCRLWLGWHCTPPPPPLGRICSHPGESTPAYPTAIHQATRRRHQHSQ